MALWVILAAVVVAILLFGFIAAAANSSKPPPYETFDGILNWDAIADEELQSYLPNKKINAIKRYRELTGVGLKESKEAIEYVIANPDAQKGKVSLSSDTGGAGVRDLVLEGRYDEAVDVYAAFMGVDRYSAEAAIKDLRREINAEVALSDPATMPDINAMVAEGRKIEAIKHYMAQTGVGLKEAKQAIEELE